MSARARVSRYPSNRLECQSLSGITSTEKGTSLPRDPSTIDFNNDYDRTAYEQLRKVLAKKPSLANEFSGRIGRMMTSQAQRVTHSLPSQVSDGAEAALRSALTGIRALTLDPALRSVSIERVLDAYRHDGHPVARLSDIRSLPLSVIDEVIPNLRWSYALGAAIEGAGAGAIITGAEVLATAGSVASAGAAAAPGAGAVLSAMAFDTATVLAASARIIAHTAAYHGYDTRKPEEQLFAMSVMSWSSASGEGAKQYAFQQLSRITQQLARSATWAQLSEHALVNVVREVYLRLGIRLTQRKLGQAIPVAGILVGAGMNASLINGLGTAANQAYRLRHLEGQYGFETEEIVGSSFSQRPNLAIDSRIDIAEIIDEASSDEESPEPSRE